MAPRRRQSDNQARTTHLILDEATPVIPKRAPGPAQAAFLVKSGRAGSVVGHRLERRHDAAVAEGKRMKHDPRFDVALYTVQEAARHLDLAPSTIRYWIADKGIVRHLPAETRGEPTLPFIAIAEIQFIHTLRDAGLSLRAVTEGVQALRRELGPGYLQKDRLAHDGRDLLVHLADTDEEWTRARDSQAGIPGVIDVGLTWIGFDATGVPERVRLQQYEGADVIIDPHFSFGQPVVAERGVRVEDIAGMFFAGDSFEVVGEEFGVPLSVVEAVVRTYGRPRAA
jgi:uncharacterized protein (DUF433 family)